MNRRLALLSALILTTSTGQFALADEPGAHPSYKHAMSDLLAAKEQIERRRPEDGAIMREEEATRNEIVAAIEDLHAADEMDGKHEPMPPPDVRQLPDGRLHATVALLTRARADVDAREDDPRTRPIQQKALNHIDAALRNANFAMQDRKRL